MARMAIGVWSFISQRFKLSYDDKVQKNFPYPEFFVLGGKNYTRYHIQLLFSGGCIIFIPKSEPMKKIIFALPVLAASLIFMNCHSSRKATASAPAASS